MYFFITALFVLNSFGQDINLPADFHKPFWKSKPDVIKRMDQEEMIVVSAKMEEIQKKPVLNEMKVVAGGIVKVPMEHAYKVVTDYEKLKEADRHFQEVKFDKKSQILFLHLEALGYHAYMHLKMMEVTPKNLTNNSPRQIQWECIKGHFLGMKGVFQLEEVGRQKTEISMTSYYKAETLPLPKILMGIGLEIIGKQVASQMRKYILEQYQR